MTRTLKSGRRFECHAGERLARVAEQPPREPRGQIVQFGVVDDGAVLDAHVHEVQRPPRVARDLRRVVEVGPDRVAAAPRVLARVRVVLELQAHEAGHAGLEQAEEALVVEAVVVVAGVRAGHEPPRHDPVALVRGPRVGLAIRKDGPEGRQRRQRADAGDPTAGRGLAGNLGPPAAGLVRRRPQVAARRSVAQGQRAPRRRGRRRHFLGRFAASRRGSPSRWEAHGSTAEAAQRELSGGCPSRAQRTPCIVNSSSVQIAARQWLLTTGAPLR